MIHLVLSTIFIDDVGSLCWSGCCCCYRFIVFYYKQKARDYKLNWELN